MRPRQRRCRSGPDVGLRATKPRELERFIDNCSEGEFGGLMGGRGSRATLGTSYAASISWDGLMMDPRPFARFDERNTLTLTKKPVGNAGFRVIELEGHPPGGIFGRPATVPGRMQWTVEQEASRVFAPRNPFKQAAACGGGIAVSRPYFNSRIAVVPKVEAARPLTCAARAGPQVNEALLTPDERRKINDYETKMDRAMKLGRKARHQKARLDFITRHRYPEGAIGVDSPFNPASEVYAEKRLSRQKREAASFEKERARRKRLDGIIGDPHQRFGFDPWQHPEPSGGAGIQHLPPRELKVAMGGVCSDIGGGGHDAPLDRRGRNGGEHFLQAKERRRWEYEGRQAQRPGEPTGRTTTIINASTKVNDFNNSDTLHPQKDTTNPVPPALPAAPTNANASTLHPTATAVANAPRPNTYTNIFGARERVPKSDPRVRAQRLWDEGCGRRRYDIVTGTRLPLSAARAERPPGRLAHPSQQSLERGRNLQGSSIPV